MGRGESAVQGGIGPDGSDHDKDRGITSTVCAHDADGISPPGLVQRREARLAQDSRDHHCCPDSGRDRWSQNRRACWSHITCRPGSRAALVVPATLVGLPAGTALVMKDIVRNRNDAGAPVSRLLRRVYCNGIYSLLFIQGPVMFAAVLIGLILFLQPEKLRRPSPDSHHSHMLVHRLEVDVVALHLLVQRCAIDAEGFRSLLTVPAAGFQSLNDQVSFRFGQGGFQ